MSLLSALYGAAARRRRRWYAERPASRRRLARPVVSVGALTVGGSGKTPVAGHVAALLVRAGERPAVLSRGYGRAVRPREVVVVRDREGVRAGLAEAGDEPLMLAERLAGVCVLVCADRHRAGRLAEDRFDVTVHVLDDGFQHLALHRDVDLVVIGVGDAAERRTLPRGRLREPPESAAAADALIVEAATAEEADAVARRFGGSGSAAVFRLVRRLGAPRVFIQPPRHQPPRSQPPRGQTARGQTAGGAPAPGAPGTLAPAPAIVPEGARVLVVAGIARPAAFADDVRAAGYDVAETMAFADHHRYSARDVARLMRRAQALGAAAVLTTEKDLVRLRPLAPFAAPLAAVPLEAAVEPAGRFAEWLAERLAAARRARGEGG